jgi:hypothetical protein
VPETRPLLIKRLVAASRGSRFLDRKVGVHLGYTRVPESADGTTKASWRDPTGTNVRLPRFTSSVDAAIGLVKRLCPDDAVALRVTDGASLALIEGAGYCRGASPALSICIAALSLVSGASDEEFDEDEE